MKIGLIVIVLLIGLIYYFWESICENWFVKFCMRIPYFIAIGAAILIMIFPRNYDEIPGMISDYWHS